MTNAEFYKDEIKKFEGINFCDNFIKPIILGGDCKEIYCEHCHTLVMLWLMEEHKEPETDWSKVPIDTPILVRGDEDDEWRERHFAGVDEHGAVTAWAEGRTSFSATDAYAWRCAKLWEGSEERKAEQEAAK